MADRNIDRARCRWERAQISPIPDDVGPLASTVGAALKIPSNDEMVPDLLPGAPSLRFPLGLESPSESAPDSGVDRPTNGVRTPKRSGGDLDAPSSRRVRTESQGMMPFARVVNS